jgi:hypothetical protein
MLWNFLPFLEFFPVPSSMWAYSVEGPSAQDIPIQHPSGRYRFIYGLTIDYLLYPGGIMVGRKLKDRLHMRGR